MIKYLVSSFYNTMIDEEDAIPTSTMFELDRVKQKNIKFIVLTNRLKEDVLYYNHDYPFIDYIISLNGSIITEVETNKNIFLKSFTKEELDHIQTKYSKKEIYYYTENTVENSIPQESVYKIEIKGIKKNIETEYNTSILKRNKEYFLEICKNNSLDTLEKLKIKEDELLGIIGNESEENLLKKYKKVFVVKNASKKLKDKTKNITKSNKQKGLEQVLKEVIK